MGRWTEIDLDTQQLTAYSDAPWWQKGFQIHTINVVTLKSARLGRHLMAFIIHSYHRHILNAWEQLMWSYCSPHNKKYFVLLVDNGTKSTHWSFTSPLPCAKKTNENNLILTFDLCFICTPPCQLTFGDERWNSFTGRLGMAGALWCTFVFLSHSAC